MRCKSGEKLLVGSEERTQIRVHGTREQIRLSRDFCTLRRQGVDRERASTPVAALRKVGVILHKLTKP